ncbi:hypothetical protein DKX38_026704 [Salix brachista]|uniref:1,4-dihydroxy-2-naphthoate octaprenyltransferase n=1 Tax=Salix brachista TaxID=2182728 RepID=A0A5N5JC34_9ROSI|nr:hypothetical protein DKX38_026704 [Salix brachista]
MAPHQTGKIPLLNRAQFQIIKIGRTMLTSETYILILMLTCWDFIGPSISQNKILQKKEEFSFLLLSLLAIYTDRQRQRDAWATGFAVIKKDKLHYIAIMAAAFCSLHQGSSLKKLQYYHMRQSYATRQYNLISFEFTSVDSAKLETLFEQKLREFGVKLILGVKHNSRCSRHACLLSYPGALTSNVSKKSSMCCCTAQNFVRGVRISRLEFKKEILCWRVFSGSLANYADNAHDGESGEDVPKATLIWRAVKLPIYSVALVPLTVGGAAAYLQTGIFSARRYLSLLVSSILIITWLNLSNDVYDFDTGADKNKKESVVNLVGSRSVAFIAAYSSLLLGFAGLAWTSIGAGNIHAILFLAFAIICGYVYQCPPFRLSYQGLGEPLCFAAFGPFATSAFYLLLGSTSEMSILPLTGTILSASLLVGFTTTLILFCSHFHQVEEDKAVGKFSPLVRLGTERGSGVVKVAVATLYSLLFVFGLSRTLPLTCIEKGKIFMAKYFCVRLHALFGAALASGLVAARAFQGYSL